MLSTSTYHSIEFETEGEDKEKNLERLDTVAKLLSRIVEEKYPKVRVNLFGHDYIDQHAEIGWFKGIREREGKEGESMNSISCFSFLVI